MSKKLLIVRLILFITFAVLIPVIFIGVKYGIFKNPSALSFSGVGVLAVIIVLGFSFFMVNQLKKAMPYSMVTQIITGTLTVIVPLVCFYCLLNAIRGSIDIFLECLLVTIISEFVAIIVNPFPQLMQSNENKKQDDFLTKVKEIMKGEK